MTDEGYSDNASGHPLRRGVSKRFIDPFAPWSRLSIGQPSQNAAGTAQTSSRVKKMIGRGPSIKFHLVGGRLLLRSVRFRFFCGRLCRFSDFSNGRSPRTYRIFAPDPILSDRPEKRIRVKNLDRTGIVQTFSRLCRDRKLHRAQVILQLRKVRSSDDRRSNAGLSGSPIQCYLRRLSIELLRHIEKSIQHSPVVLRKSVK